VEIIYVVFTVVVVEEQRRIYMNNQVRRLMYEAEIKKHTGFCMCDYLVHKCNDCYAEFECLKLFVKEKADVEARTVGKMMEVQDGRD